MLDNNWWNKLMGSKGMRERMDAYYVAYIKEPNVLVKMILKDKESKEG